MSEVSIADVAQHVVKFGIDIYPQIDIAADRTRLNMFFEQARERHPELYEQLLASDTEFKVSKQFRRRPEVARPSASADTFVLTSRGPVFIFPLRLPVIGATSLEGQYMDLFREMRSLFQAALPGRKSLRIGLIRELIFDFGQAPCLDLLTSQDEFAGARLGDGGSVFHYVDDECNVRIKFELGEATKSVQLPVGQTVTEKAGFALFVHFDVNSREIRPLEDADIEGVLDRATSLWPDELLKFFRERRAI